MNSKFHIIILLLFITSGLVFSQSNWFEAQSEKAVVKSIISTSELVEGQYQGRYLYPPINLLDGDFDTTWCEADEGGSGIGESITLELEEPLTFNEIQLVNGFSSGNDYYHKNNRVAKITLTQTAGQHFQQKQYTLQDDAENWQSIHFDLKQTAQIINIRIDDVYRGYKYDDTCFSDIRFLMDGRVIPFENVETIRVVQEEHSRSLLNSEKGDFLRKIKNIAALTGSDRTIYLRKSESHRGLVFHFNQNETFTGAPLSFYMARTIWYPLNDSTYNGGHLSYSLLNDGGRYKYFSGTDELYSYMEDRGQTSFVIEQSWGFSYPDHSLGEYKLITRKNVDYVQTETIQLLKLDGTAGIYINGIYYEILDEEHLLILEEDGP